MVASKLPSSANGYKNHWLDSGQVLTHSWLTNASKGDPSPNFYYKQRYKHTSEWKPHCNHHRKLVGSLSAMYQAPRTCIPTINSACKHSCQIFNAFIPRYQRQPNEISFTKLFVTKQMNIKIADQMDIRQETVGFQLNHREDINNQMP